MTALLLRVLLGGLMRTLRIEVRCGAGASALLAGERPFVHVFWHGSMLLPWWSLRRRRVAALVSQSHDGGLLASLLASWGYHVVRGSSSRGSKEAMASMRALVGEGFVLCLTPDGPRGPIHEMKMGAVRVAQTMGVPLLMATVTFRHAIVLGSWDRFLIPWPFTRSVIEYSEPVIIDPHLEGESLETRRLALEKEMMAQHRRTQGA